MRRRYSPIHYENSGLFTITIALPPMSFSNCNHYNHYHDPLGRGNGTMEAKETIDGSGK
jgi:hypothetical protein